MKPTPKISICVVARNAERTYKRLFDSLREFKERGGDMVLVDTGSTDNTRDIYLAFGFRVHPVGDKFQIAVPEDVTRQVNENAKALGDPEIIPPGSSLFNFAAARNHAASLALNDYIINPDADEELTVFDIDAVEQTFGRYSRFRYDFVFSHNADGTPYHQFVTDTRASDRRYWRWKGHVHETNEAIGGDKSTMGYVPPNVFKIEHWQVPSPTRGNYLPGLAYACHVEPHNDRNCHYYARELMYRKFNRSAIEEFKRHLKLSKWDAERSQSMLFMGDCYDRLGDTESKLYWYHRAADECGTRREPFMRLAWHWYTKGDHRKASNYASAALDIPKSAFYGDIPENYTHAPHQILYWAQWWLGDRLASRFHWQKALAFSPKHPKFLADAQFYTENAK